MTRVRPAVAALLVGVALLASPVALLQFQEPKECANSVEPATDAADASEVAATYRYAALSTDAKRAFDRARSATGSAIVSGERCPEAFAYTAELHRYLVVKDGTEYVLTTYENDLIPEVAIASVLLAYLGASVLGIGLAARDDPNARFPFAAGAVGLVTLVAVAVAVVLDWNLWPAMGWTALVTAATFVGAGATLPPRRALLLAGLAALLPGAVVLPLTGVSLLVLAPAVLPLLLVGIGIGGRAAAAAVRE